MPDTPPPIDDPDAPPTDDERASAEELRGALEDPSRARAEASLARSLRAAWSPADLPADVHRRILATALASVDPAAGRRARVVRVTFAASLALALAAGVMAVLRTPWGGSAPSPPSPVAVSRSTQALFADRFPSFGGETARIDRIALARTADLRDNQFTRWGVR